MGAKFGPAGLAESFKAMGYKNYDDLADYLEKMGLDTFEYQCGRGVRTKEDVARKIGGLVAQKGISISVHAPYYISLSSVEEEKRLNSANYILQSAKLIDYMGGNRVILHSGSCGKISREEALSLAKVSLKHALNVVDDNGLGHITLCPETMGKVNQLGSLEEVMELCKVDERLIPCIDFGHLNTREFGILKDIKNVEKIFEIMENEIGIDRLKVFHSHFSKIEFTENGGEKKHLTFADTVYGPDFEPVMDIVARKNLSPTFICESAGTQSEDALTMKNYYKQQAGM